MTIKDTMVDAVLDNDVEEAATVADVDESLRDAGYVTWPGAGHIALRAESANDDRAKRRIARIVDPLGWTCFAAGTVLRCEPA